MLFWLPSATTSSILVSCWWLYSMLSAPRRLYHRDACPRVGQAWGPASPRARGLGSGMCALCAWLGVGALSALAVCLLCVGAERRWYGWRLRFVLRRVVPVGWYGVGSRQAGFWFGSVTVGRLRLVLARVDGSRCGSVQACNMKTYWKESLILRKN